MPDTNPDHPPKPDWEHVQWHVNPPDTAPPSRISTVIAFVLCIVFVGLFAGAAFAFEPYYFAFFRTDHSRLDRQENDAALKQIETDTIPAMKTRFWLGCTLGTGGAVLYWFTTRKRT